MTARSVSPTSTPATRSVTGREAGAGTSTTKELSYLPDPRHRRRGGGQGPGQLEPETSDLGENHEADPVDGPDELESGITRVTGRLLAPLVLEPGRPGLLSPAPAPDGIEEVPVGAVRIRQGLLEGHRRHLGRPGPFVGGLRGRERGGELRLSGDLVPGLPGGLPGGEGSIEHDPPGCTRIPGTDSSPDPRWDTPDTCTAAPCLPGVERFFPIPWVGADRPVDRGGRPRASAGALPRHGTATPAEGAPPPPCTVGTPAITGRLPTDRPTTAPGRTEP